MEAEGLYIEGQLCYCKRIPVQQTFHTAKDAGRRYMACQGCGYFEFVDPPLCSRAVDAIHELNKKLKDEKLKNFWEMDKIRKAEADKFARIKKKMVEKFARMKKKMKKKMKKMKKKMKKKMLLTA